MAPPAPKKSRTAPKFNAGHLDPHRARKLKKEWISTQKLKAKYRAEKRRMGLRKAPEVSKGDEADGNVREYDDTAKADSSDTDSPADDSFAETEPPRQSVAASSRTRGMYAKPASPRAAPSKPAPPKPAISRRNTKMVADEKPEQDGPSLRELAREAYSPASLHTFKSHPLRRRAHGNNRARAQTNPYPARTDAKGRKGAPPHKKGQPDMAKRMGVLLERIKRSSQ